MYEFRQQTGADGGASSTHVHSARGSSDSPAAVGHRRTTSATEERDGSSHHESAGLSGRHREAEEDGEEDVDDCSADPPALVHPLLKRSNNASAHGAAALTSNGGTKKPFEIKTGHRRPLERSSSIPSSLSQYNTTHDSSTSENDPAVGGAQTLPPAPTTTVSVNDLDADLRQLAILQTLLQRQQAIVQASVEAAAAAKRLKRKLEDEENAASARGAARSAATGSEGETSSSTNSLGRFQPLSSALHGVQHQPQQQSSSALRDPSSWLEGLNTIHDSAPNSNSAAELAQAQQQLDLWAKVAFTSHVGTPLPSNNNGSASPARAPSAAPFPFHRSRSGDAGGEEDQEIDDERDGNLGPEFDWSSFYPSLLMDSPGRANAPTTSASTTVAPFVVGGVVNPASSIAAVLDGRVGLTTTSTPTSSTSSDSKDPLVTRPSTESLSRRASISSRQRKRSPSPPLVDPSLIDELLQDEYPLRPPLTEGTPEEIEQDKRRRNTEASARFRARKKQRDAVLLQTSAQLRARAQALEKEKLGLVKENQWLRELAQAAGARAGTGVGAGGGRKRV
ncbi:BZ3500_MvSof-1268-A1-R1_Chr8-2g10238 [Microbotryum saponariae]|uniref:BZ3500_MvSof-1268-A1-R1_Chr8-2g10238 protein n=1 Tax=Microbotryum saponariae TaxID=289078 RepID=A0A2X0N9P4_9BASI|nr:BZ3500_MvSof-1268-A1-R1_Chr8-2g10238 [Microbotryum saponariae]SDA02036.1 BZ3501_MvSof-1269-A2-R1_Chr8-2g09988 [Microbotryum saponariae]